jgi:hypothetical protein
MNTGTADATTKRRVPALVGDIVSLRVRADAIAVVKFAGAAVE